jgi:hypothetical protein
MGKGPPEGFEYAERCGEVVISHRGAKATILRGSAARRFLEDVARDDPQMVMAKTTGNFKRGNERVARSHPRNRGVR